jgi:zinc transporter 1/2/3
MSTPEIQNFENPELLLYFKIGCIIIIITVTLIFGLMPLFYNISRSSKFLGIANAFSGGLFMGIGLFHLLPEAQENFDSYYSNPEFQGSFFSSQPLSYYIAFISYSLILFLEKVAFNSHSLTAHTHGEEGIHIHHDDLHEPLLNHYDDDLESNKKKRDIAEEFFKPQNPFDKNNNVYHDCTNLKNPTNKSSDNANIHGQRNNLIIEEKDDSDEDENTIKNVLSSKGQFASFLQTRNIMENKKTDKKLDKSLYAATKIIERATNPQKYDNYKFNESNNQLIELSKNENYDKNNNEDHYFTPTSTMTPYILLIALSLHGLFEGTALGVMKTMRNTIFLLLAILAHKWAESFALGISFYKSGTEKGNFIKMIILFSLFTPLGIIIGLIFSGNGLLIQGILLSISGGTFLYVSASEVIVEEFSITKYKFWKYGFYLLGGVLVGILKIFEVEE